MSNNNGAVAVDVDVDIAAIVVYYESALLSILGRSSEMWRRRGYGRAKNCCDRKNQEGKNVFKVVMIAAIIAEGLHAMAALTDWYVLGCVLDCLW